jgi:hypothetical protein
MLAGPPPLADPLTGLSAGRLRTVALAIFGPRIGKEELAATAAFTSGRRTTHGALHFGGARPGRKRKRRSGSTPNRKKEEELCEEEREENPAQENGISNRLLSPTFIPPLRASRKQVQAQRNDRGILSEGGEVTTLAYSPDGQRLITGGSDGTVAVWDSASGQQLSRLETTNQPIRRVAVSPDGQRLVAVAERAAWVWELQSGKLIHAFPPNLVAADVSPLTLPEKEIRADSRRLLREEEGSTPPTPQETRTSLPTNRIAAVFADDTGEHFATIDPDGGLTLWREGRAPQHLITIRGSLPEPVRRVFFSPDGRWMANAGEENTAHVWDLATGNEHLSIGERVHQVVFSRDGNRMVTHGSETWITTWSPWERRRPPRCGTWRRASSCFDFAANVGRGISWPIAATDVGSRPEARTARPRSGTPEPARNW